VTSHTNHTQHNIILSPVLSPASHFSLSPIPPPCVPPNQETKHMPEYPAHSVLNQSNPSMSPNVTHHAERPCFPFCHVLFR
jgi:hypothetical protein